MVHLTNIINESKAADLIHASFFIQTLSNLLKINIHIIVYIVWKKFVIMFRLLFLSFIGNPFCVFKERRECQKIIFLHQWYSNINNEKDNNSNPIICLTSSQLSLHGWMNFDRNDWSCKVMYWFLRRRWMKNGKLGDWLFLIQSFVKYLRVGRPKIRWYITRSKDTESTKLVNHRSIIHFCFGV